MLADDIRDVTEIAQSIADAVARDLAKANDRIATLEAQVAELMKAAVKVTPKGKP